MVRVLLVRHGMTKGNLRSARAAIQGGLTAAVVARKVQEPSDGLEELRERAKRYCVAHFRQIRQHARSTLTPLAQHPELMLEIMMDAI